MGRRSVNTTKSGKFMNPTDQARKEARKKELKKNKKQRLLVRTAVLKNKDPGLIIGELDKLDEVEYNPTQAPALAEKVLKDKRKKLRETLDRVMKLYQKENPSYWSELKKVEGEYERRRFHRIQYFEAVKQAENTQVEDIPLPEMIPGAGGPSSSGGGSSSIADIPLPGEEGDGPQIPGILKKSLMIPSMPVALPPPPPTFQGRDPPGVPAGAPPDLSDMDELSDEDEEEMEVERTVAEAKSKSVRFQGEDSGREPGENRALSEMDRFMKEIEEESKMFLEEEDLLPPGTEDSSAPQPKPVAASSEIPTPTAAAASASICMPDSPPSPELPPIPPEPVIPAPPPSGPSGPIRPPPPSGAPPPLPQFFPPPLPGLAMGARMRFPPPPMQLPPMRPGGFNMPPGPGRPPSFGGHGHGGGPHGSRFRQAHPRPSHSQVFSSAPQIIKSDTKIVSETMIQAKPQIRSLSADVTRFVPSIVKQKKDDGEKPKRHEYQIGQSQAAVRSLQQAPRPLGPNKDDAYAEFMKEMSGLM